MKMGMEADMSIAYGYKTKQPSSLLSSIFMSTANAAAKTLVSVSKTQQTEKWKAMDHMRFMVMIITWLTLWVLRVLMDYLPSSSIPYSPQYLLGFVGSLALPGPSSSLSSSSSSFPSLDLVVHGGLDGPSVQALGRALSQVSLAYLVTTCYY